MTKKTFGLVLLGTVLAVSGACSQDPEVAKRAFMKSGDQYTGEKKFPEAVIEYRNAVQQDPKFGEARFKLAKTYEQVGDIQKAYGEYIRAADLLPGDVKAQVSAANMLLLARQFEDANARADKALKAEPGNVEAQIAKGNALAGLKNLDAAVAEIESAILLDPSRSNSYSNLGTLQLARGNRDEAEAAFKKATETDPKSLPARLALANFYWNIGQIADAERELQAAIVLNPRDIATNRAFAVFYLSTNRAPQAESHLKTIVDVSKSSLDTLVLADYYILAGRRPDATAVLLELEKKDAASFAAANIRLASLSLQAGDAPGANKLIDAVLVKEPKNVSALVAKADLLLADKKYDAALASAQEAATTDPRALVAHYSLGKIYTARQDWDAAIGALNEVLKINPQAPGVRLDLARLSLAKNKPDDAIQYAQEALKGQPANGDASLVLSRALLMKGDTAGAEPRTRQLATEFPKSAAVQNQLGQVAASKGDTAGARQAFERALALSSNDLDALAGLATLDFRAKNPAAARARIDERVGPDTKDPKLLMLAARVYSATGDPAATERVLRKVIEIDSSYMDAYAMLGQFYASQNRMDEAKAEFERLAQLRPKSAVGAHTLIAIILQMQNKPGDAQARYEKVMALDPRASVAANNLAWLYAEGGGNLDVALQLAQTAKAQMPDRPEVSDTLGWVYYKKGLSGPAVLALKEAVEKAPKNAMYQYHLGLAYAKNGSNDDARKALGLALQLSPGFEGAADAQKVLTQLKS